MKIKLTLLGVYAVTFFSINGYASSSKLSLSSDNDITLSSSMFCENNLKILIGDSAYKQGDIYVINIYDDGRLYHSETLHSLSTNVLVSSSRISKLVVEVVKYDAQKRTYGVPVIISMESDIIAVESDIIAEVPIYILYLSLD